MARWRSVKLHRCAPRVSQKKTFTMSADDADPYDLRFIDTSALCHLIDCWMVHRKRRIHALPPNSTGDAMSDLLCKFGSGVRAVEEKRQFDKFYSDTKTEFFLDESVSTFQDALCELQQPHMLEFFLREMHALFSGRKMAAELLASVKPKIVSLTEEELEALVKEREEEHEAFREIAIRESRERFERQGRQRCWQAPQVSMLLQKRQSMPLRETAVAARRSKRQCVLLKRQASALSSAWSTITAPTVTMSPTAATADQLTSIHYDNDQPETGAMHFKKRRNQFSAVQWKRLQVVARKQLHRAVLEYDFAAVQRIADNWCAESEDERRLDFDAVEWALRRLCKQLLPMAPAKAETARANSLAMIDTLFECFRPMRLCRAARRFGGTKCMRQHLNNIVASVPNRFDIAQHLLRVVCDCSDNSGATAE